MAATIRVKATNAAGTSGPSNESPLIVGTGPCAARRAPQRVTLTGNSGGTRPSRTPRLAAPPPTSSKQARRRAANLANSDLGGTATTFTTSGVAAARTSCGSAPNSCGTSGPSNEVTLVVPSRLRSTLNAAPAREGAGEPRQSSRNERRAEVGARKDRRETPYERVFAGFAGFAFHGRRRFVQRFDPQHDAIVHIDLYCPLVYLSHILRQRITRTSQLDLSTTREGS